MYVRPKLTFVSFFYVFFLNLPLSRRVRTLLKSPIFQTYLRQIGVFQKKSGHFEISDMAERSARQVLYPHPNLTFSCH